MNNTSFAVTDTWSHDLSITDNAIDMADDDALFAQKVQAVWSTNHGEWSLNTQEGIDRYVILGKNPDEDAIRDELEAALEMISESAHITEFSMEMDKAARHAVITVRIQNEGKEYEIPLEYD